MKIMTVLGSPRKKGNTAGVLGMFEAAVSKDHEVVRKNISDVTVNGCLGCMACQKTEDAPGCVQKDDMPDLIDVLLASDLVVYATPLYCWGFTAQMKAFIDRHFCLVKGLGSDRYISLAAGKKSALLATCAGPIEGNADCLQTVFDRMNGYISGESVGKYILPFCTVPGELGDAAEALAQKMASDAAAAL